MTHPHEGRKSVCVCGHYKEKHWGYGTKSKCREVNCFCFNFLPIEPPQLLEE